MNQIKNVSTWTGGGGSLLTAFTMAEILLSLTIIGVVAAITLPSLTGNINERTWNAQRKALYARMSQAIALMPALNGYGTLTEESSSGASDAVDTAAETFVTDGLAKVLKINNICDSEHLPDCGIVSSYTNIAASVLSMPTTLYELNSYFRSASYNGQSYSGLDTRAAAFETQNGESIVAFYSPNCKTVFLAGENTDMYGNIQGFVQANMCANFIYDLNGSKGPNTVGKDIGFISVFNATDSVVVAPMPLNRDVPGSPIGWTSSIASECKKMDDDSRLPNIDELSAMFVNNELIGLLLKPYVSGSVYNSSRVWGVELQMGTRGTHYRGTSSKMYVRCIKR